MLLLYILLILSISGIINSQQQCYRCFGSNFCNNPADPSFQTNVHIVDCPATDIYENLPKKGSLLVQKLLKHLEESSRNHTATFSTWGCLTATIHEDHEVHTIRTCINNAVTICPTVVNVVLNPGLNEIPENVEIDCGGCTGDACNDHSFLRPESTTSPSSSTTITSTSTKNGTSTVSELSTSTTTTETLTSEASSTTTGAPGESTTEDSSGDDKNDDNDGGDDGSSANTRVASYILLILASLSVVLGLY
ncbi:putative uncharacterized protein DDB_G0281733 [Anthonomus grandis grandis]|uniref:putative uncharacterized protein DDB_G0281733 n=1 Tax=Anthonomus grandis grandis TaxID=2921223 RepID=UPI002166644A|nr:putative uncharacterized protein DDB_G0281733 [Anthonomus grandis grandis]